MPSKYRKEKEQENLDGGVDQIPSLHLVPCVRSTCIFPFTSCYNLSKRWHRTQFIDDKSKIQKS